MKIDPKCLKHRSKFDPKWTKNHGDCRISPRWLPSYLFSLHFDAYIHSFFSSMRLGRSILYYQYSGYSTLHLSSSGLTINGQIFNAPPHKHCVRIVFISFYLIFNFKSKSSTWMKIFGKFWEKIFVIFWLKIYYFLSILSITLPGTLEDL